MPLEKITGFAKDYLQSFTDLFSSTSIRHRQVVQKWSPPIQDTVKTNFDGAWFTESDDACIGVVLRNSEGEVMATMSEKMLKPPSIEILEQLAARCAVVFTVETGFHQAVIEGDAESVIKSLHSGGMEFARGGHVIKDILSYKNSF